MSQSMKKADYDDILKAYRLLFATRHAVTPELLTRLQSTAVHNAYKKMAMDSHPDRACHLGVSRAILESRFKEVNNAYTVLSDYVENRSASSINRPAAARKNTWHSSRNGRNHYNAGGGDSQQSGRSHDEKTTDTVSRGRSGQAGRHPTAEGAHFLPGEELMLGQFLFYSGIITLNTLVEAIIWQRKQRPSFGRIAMEWRILKQQDILDILKKRLPREKIGDCAHRLGYINNIQYKAILLKQRNLQKPIGSFFITRGILTETEMQAMNQKLMQHNRYIREQRTKNNM
jgi:hypothetical protein